jgi:hypothetical protein
MADIAKDEQKEIKSKFDTTGFLKPNSKTKWDEKAFSFRCFARSAFFLI